MNMTAPTPTALQPLSDLPAGASGVIRQLQGGSQFSARMAALGFSVGAPVTIIQNFGHGPLIVNLRGSRLALGRGEAAKVRAEITQTAG
jgi:ferrous iron transport protein A